jgi:hypothetical protein
MINNTIPTRIATLAAKNNTIIHVNSIIVELLSSIANVYTVQGEVQHSMV